MTLPEAIYSFMATVSSKLGVAVILQAGHEVVSAVTVMAPSLTPVSMPYDAETGTWLTEALYPSVKRVTVAVGAFVS